MVSEEARKLLALFTDDELQEVFLRSSDFESRKAYPSVSNADKNTLQVVAHQTDAFHLVEGIEPSESATSVIWQVDDSPQYFYTYFNSSVPVSRESIADYSWRLHDKFAAPETVYDGSGTPLDGLELISGWVELDWVTDSLGSPTMTVGGKPQGSLFTADNWPHVSDGDALLPLKYYAEIEAGNEKLTVFIGTTEKLQGETDLADWEPDELNAVFVGDSIPDHVTMQPLKGVKLDEVLIVDVKHETSSPLPKYPFWIQEEEIPDGMQFVAELVSGVAEIDEVMFGDMGIAYVFISQQSSDKKACVLYQSS